MPSTWSSAPRLVDFGGWEMPLSYPEGTIAEHLACRNDAAVFDVSHLGTVRVKGPGSLELLQAKPHERPRRSGPGRAQYTAPARRGRRLGRSTTSSSGGSARTASTSCRTPRTPTAVISVLGGEDVTSQRAVIAVQGPRARARLASVSPDAAAVGHFAVARLRVQGRRRAASQAPATPARTASSAPCRPRSPRLLAGRDRRGREARRPRGPRHSPARVRASPSRTRARRGHHLAAGRARLGRRLGQGTLPWPRASRGRAHRRCRAPCCAGFSPIGRRPPRNEDPVFVGDEAKAS